MQKSNPYFIQVTKFAALLLGITLARLALALFYRWPSESSEWIDIFERVLGGKSTYAVMGNWWATFLVTMFFTLILSTILKLVRVPLSWSVYDIFCLPFASTLFYVIESFYPQSFGIILITPFIALLTAILTILRMTRILNLSVYIILMASLNVLWGPLIGKMSIKFW